MRRSDGRRAATGRALPRTVAEAIIGLLTTLFPGRACRSLPRVSLVPGSGKRSGTGQQRPDRVRSSPGGSVQIVHVLTVVPTLPVVMLDDMLTSLEKALVEMGATRIWIDPERPALAIMAELPDVLEPAPDGLFRV